MNCKSTYEYIVDNFPGLALPLVFITYCALNSTYLQVLAKSIRTIRNLMWRVMASDSMIIVVDITLIFSI